MGVEPKTLYNQSLMKIAIFTDTYSPQINGVVTSTITFAHELEKLGHKVVIMGPRMKGATDSTDKVWRFRSFPFIFQKEYMCVSPFSRQLRKFKSQHFDIIHVQTPFSMGHLGQYLGWKYNIPVVHTYHTHWEEYLHYFPLLPHAIRKKLSILLLSKTFCNRCKHVIVPSSQIQDKLLEYKVTSPISIIPTGIELHQAPSQEAIQNFRSRFHLAPEIRYMIFVGRLGTEKNTSFLLESAQKVIQKLPHIKLLIVGDGPERNAMKTQAASLGIEDQCIFTGYLPHKDVFTAYAAAHVITFPSKTETQGLSLLEGLSLGKPAVCINAMGVKDILEKGGFLTSETAEFSDKIMALFTQGDLYQKKSEEALERANQFSSAAMAQKLLAVYQKACRKDFNQEAFL